MKKISNMCIANFMDTMAPECLVFLNKIMLNIYENFVKNLSGGGSQTFLIHAAR